jgi:hypothetical protein
VTRVNESCPRFRPDFRWEARRGAAGCSDWQASASGEGGGATQWRARAVCFCLGVFFPLHPIASSHLATGGSFHGAGAGPRAADRRYAIGMPKAKAIIRLGLRLRHHFGIISHFVIWDLGFMYNV